MGLSISLDELEIQNNTVNYDGRLWYINELNKDSQYVAVITSRRPCSFHVHKIDFYNGNIIL